MRQEAWENIEFNVASASDVTVYFILSGTDTATSKYMGMGRSAKGIVVRPSKDMSIVSMGNTTFKSPISVTPEGGFTAKNMPHTYQMVVRTSDSDTVVRVLVL